MAIIGQIQLRLGRRPIRGIREFLNIIIWTDDPKTLYPGPDSYLHPALKRL
jgi:hypothetical protein